MLLYTRDLSGNDKLEKAKNVAKKMLPVSWCKQITIIIGENFSNVQVEHILDAKFLESDINKGLFVFDDKLNLL